MTHRICILSITAALATLCLAAAAQATTYNVTGSWSTTLNGEGYIDEIFAGTAEFTYSDDTVTGTGLENVQGSLSAFTLSPNPLGATTFDLTNTGYYVVYNNGSLYQVIVGATVNTVTSTAQNTDDFAVVDFVNSNENIAVSVAAFPSTLISQFSPDVTVEFTVTPVPEPASLTLLAMGALAMQRRRPTR